MPEISEITLLITENQIDSLISSTKEDLPNESCSLLLGNVVDCEYRVNVLQRMNNVAHSEYSFTMDPDEVLKVCQWASNKGLDVIGVYHSHLDGAGPSSTDLTFMQINPVVWLIYELSSSRFRAFMLAHGALEEVKITISKD